MLKYSFVAGSLLVLLSRGVSAQVPLPRIENKWEISVLAGISGLGDGTFATPVEGGTTQDVAQDFETSYVVGVRVTENLGQYFGAELEYSFVNQPVVLLNLSPSVSRLDVDHKVHKFAYSILVYGRDRAKRIRPFGSIGVGTSLFQVTNDSQDEALRQGVDLKNRWKVAFSYGAGVKFQMGPGWGLRADFRDQVTGVSDWGLPSQAAVLENGEIGPAFRPDGVLHNWQISGGFMYTFR